MSALGVRHCSAQLSVKGERQVLRFSNDSFNFLGIVSRQVLNVRKQSFAGIHPDITVDSVRAKWGATMALFIATHWAAQNIAASTKTAKRAKVIGVREARRSCSATTVRMLRIASPSSGGHKRIGTETGP